MILKWNDDSDLYSIITLIIILNVLVQGLFLICEPGARMTTEFEIFENELGRCDWYALPIETQRLYLIFLSNAQNPVQICSYAGIVCSRDTIKRVSRKFQIHTNRIRSI